MVLTSSNGGRGKELLPPVSTVGKIHRVRITVGMIEQPRFDHLHLFIPLFLCHTLSLLVALTPSILLTGGFSLYLNVVRIPGSGFPTTDHIRRVRGEVRTL